LKKRNYIYSAERIFEVITGAAHWGELLALIKFYVKYGVVYRSPSTGA